MTTPVAERGPQKLFLNRELSWLDFNERVLEEAEDSSLPLLERLKFLCIFGANLDEFFMVRVARMRKQMAAGLRTAYPDGQTPSQVHARVCDEVRRLTTRQQKCLTDEVLPQLREEGVIIHQYDELPAKQKKLLRKRFQRELAPVLTPLALDPGHPFPHLLDRGLNLILEVKRSPQEEKTSFAVLQLPPSIPRLIHVGPRADSFEWVLLEELVKANVDHLFPGYHIVSCGPLRLTRNAELELEDEVEQDLIETVESALDDRPWSPAVRLQIPVDAAPAPIGLLCRDLGLEETEIFRVRGLLDVGRLQVLTGLDIPRLRFPPHHPRTVLRNKGASVYRWIRAQNRLIHHPYESFDSIAEFITAAADDPKCLAIKQTLYRTSLDSPMVAALKRAARNQKQVTVLVELKARFDEPHNIQIAREMEECGVHVVYGIPGMKIHCKATLIVRREDEGMIRRYVHLGTGNYHPKTARLYTDLSFFSCDEDLGEEVAQLFNFLTGYSQYNDWKRLLVAPRSLRRRLLELIRHETEAAKSGKKARIVAKMNSLEDPEIIRHLYRASQAGVTIDLVVRGFCCLRPGIPELSENIRVFSVVGKFLEHSRIYYFWAGGAERIFMGSADWMPRNLDRRVESLVEIQDREIKERMILEGLECSLADNVKGRQLQPTGDYFRRIPGKAEPFDSQLSLAACRVPPALRNLELTRGEAPVVVELAPPPKETKEDRKRKRRRVKQAASQKGAAPRAS